MSKAIIAEYIWLGGKDTFQDIRSKCRTMYVDELCFDPSKYPVWNFDGSSTGQNQGLDTEILLKPAAVFLNPLMENAVVVLSECFFTNGKPTACNTRFYANQVFEEHKEKEPWFGMEQEYVMLGADGRPLDWPTDGFPGPQGPYYCGNGRFMRGRPIAMEHYELCLKAGLKISGTNAEVMPSQWEYQVGPCTGIEAGDHMVMSRWVFARLCEKHNMTISYAPKPESGDWNGSGCHTNFSVAEHRAEGGYAAIEASVQRMGRNALEDIRFYGKDNQNRLTGIHETASVSTFSWGVGTRHTSIRIPNDTKKAGKGYLEDRRPAANIDPYLVSARVFVSAEGLESAAAAEMNGDKFGLREDWMLALQVDDTVNK